MIEFKNYKGRWSRFFDVFGKNALFIFVLSGILPRLLALIRIPREMINNKQTYFSPLSWFYEKICNPLFTDPRNASLLYAICFITVMWLLAWVLDKKKIYIKV
jgi:predicted acyltransferase